MTRGVQITIVSHCGASVVLLNPEKVVRYTSSLKMKEYAFASAILLNSNICVHFLEVFIRFSVAKYPGTSWTTSEFDCMEIIKQIKIYMMFSKTSL